MLNILKSYARDIVRLFKEPSALIVLLAVLVLPSAYSWYNVAAFWDPYNNTSNISVTVVNEDAGSSTSVTGDLNVGNTIVDTLKTNTQLGWEFKSREEAFDALEAGKTYAVYLIPSTFTDDMVGFVNGNKEIKSADFQYFVNEKVGPVGPKVTDSGATTLEQTVNSMFVETVTNAVVGVYDKALEQTKTKTDQVKDDSVTKLDAAINEIKDMREGIQTADAKLASAQAEKANTLASVRQAQDKLDSVKLKLTDVSSSMSSMSHLMGSAASDVQNQMNNSIQRLEELQNLADTFGQGYRLDPAIQTMANRNNILSYTLFPAFMVFPNTLGGAASNYATIAENQRALLRQNETLLDQLDSTLSSARDALRGTDSMLETTQTDLENLKAEISVLSSATLFSQLYNNGNLDADTVSNFLGSATKVKQESLYSLSVYGAAMAPLFMCLTFWIGAFMFVIVFRQEADDEGIKNFTVAQRFISRFLFFATPAMLQAVVCCAGLMVIDIGVVDPPAFFVAGVVSSLTFMGIIYSLSMLLQHIGKGLCVILIFLQIPAGTGLYPLELTAPFYQTISDVMPFTYAISAIRESICGFYGTTYIESLAVLLAYFVTFMLLGVFLRPLLSNVNRMVARELSESGLMNGELVEVPERRFRLNQMLLILTDRAGYHSRLQANYSRYLSMYPRLMIGGLVVALAVAIASGVVCSLVGASRIIVLNIWLVDFILYIFYVIALETTKNAMRNQFALEELTEEELIEQYGARGAVHLTRRHNSRLGKTSLKAWKLHDVAGQGHRDVEHYRKHGWSGRNHAPHAESANPFVSDEGAAGAGSSSSQAAAGGSISQAAAGGSSVKNSAAFDNKSAGEPHA